MCIQTKHATELVLFSINTTIIIPNSVFWIPCTWWHWAPSLPKHLPDEHGHCNEHGHCALHTTLYTVYRLNILFPFVLFRHRAWLHLLPYSDNDKNKYKNNYVVYESEQIRVCCLPDGFSESDWRLDQGGLSAACRKYAIASVHFTQVKNECASEGMHIHVTSHQKANLQRYLH